MSLDQASAHALVEWPADLTGLPGPVGRVLGSATPAPLRMMAARGAAPGLRPEQVVIVLALLASGRFEHVENEARDTAIATLNKLPPPVTAAAISSPELPAFALDALVYAYDEDISVLEKVLIHPKLSVDTVIRLAKTGSEPVTELVATNEARLLEYPVVIETLYLNKRTRMSTADRILDLAVRNGKTLNLPAFREAAEAIIGELIVEAGGDPTPDDVLFSEAQAHADAIDQEHAADHELVTEDEEGNEVVDEKAKPLEQRIREMTVSQKIRTAMLGGATARGLLVRDKNKLVAAAVVRSPLIQESEVAAYASSRSVSEDVLRMIGANGEFTKSHAIKFNLVGNPKTPMATALRLLPHLRVDELKKLAKSKNISAQIAKLAKGELAKKTPGGQK